MNKDEALKMAIEYIKKQEIHLSFDNLRAKQHTLQACIEALEQPAPNINYDFYRNVDRPVNPEGYKK